MRLLFWRPRTKKRSAANEADRWTLWYSDYFDRDSNASLQASGDRVIDGFFALWEYSVAEAVLDSKGTSSFSGFPLNVRPGREGGGSVDVRKPLESPALGKVRKWVYPETYDKSPVGPLSREGEEILRRVARAHLAWLGPDKDWKRARTDQFLDHLLTINRPEQLR